MQSCLEEPKNDYFNCQILVTFPISSAIYIFQIDIQIIDSNGNVWNYNNCKQTIYVKVEDDVNTKKQSRHIQRMVL